MIQEVVGPGGLEPPTKGFTDPKYFYLERTISPPFTNASERHTKAGRVRDALACY